MAIRNFVSGVEFAKPPDFIGDRQRTQQNYITLDREQQELDLNKQKLDQGRVAADKAKRIEDDTRKFGEIFLAAKGNPDEVVRMAAEGAVHPDIILSYQKHISDLAEKKAQTQAHLIPVEKERLARAQGLLTEVENTPPETLVAAWPQLYAKALQIDPEAQTYLSPMQPPDARQLMLLNAHVATQDSALKKAEEIRKNATAKQQATAAADVHSEKAATLPVTQAVADATLKNPALLNPAQQSQATIAADSAKATATNRAMTLGETRRHNLETELRLKMAADPSDKPLSVTEAQTLGVPVGTTHKQAAGMTPTKPPTAAQGAIATYAARIKNAGEDLDRLTPGYGTAARAYDAITPDFINTEVGKSFDRARRDVINAILRRESGAVISDSEFDNAYKQYIPVAGDSKDRIAEKKRNREIELGSFIKAAGPAYEDPSKLVDRAQSGSGGGGQLVKMRAPNGQEKDVPADQVSAYESKGAKRVR